MITETRIKEFALKTLMQENSMKRLQRVLLFEYIAQVIKMQQKILCGSSLLGLYGMH